MHSTSRPLLLAAAVLAVAAIALPAAVVAEQAPRALEQRVVLRTHNGELHGVLPGCPPCGGVGLVPAAHNYPRAVEIFDATTGERVGVIVPEESRHAHLTCVEAAQTPDVDRCFTRGTDVLPDTTLTLTIQLDDERGLAPRIKFVARGDTIVDRRGDGDRNTTTMEIRDTVLRGETDTGVPVVVRLGESFGLAPTLGSAERVKKGTLPEYVTVVAKANAEFIIGWPDEVAVEVTPRESDGRLRVAVLSDARFDARQIDRERLTFGPTGEEARLTTCDSADVDRDGRADLACDVEARTAGFGPDDAQGVVRGLTRAGHPFEGRAAVTAGARTAALD
jgi:hypothetical protein